MQTPRRYGGRDSQRSIGTPSKNEFREFQEKDQRVIGSRTPYYFDMPNLSSPMPSKAESPHVSSLSERTTIHKKSSSNIFNRTEDSSNPVSPLKITLSRRTSECGKKNEWNVDQKTINDTGALGKSK